MLTYGFYCTLCKTGTINRNVWLRHLMEDKHQSLARDDWPKWDRDLRERSFVITCNFPVAESDFLVNWFSSVTNLVSDFVWNPDNDKVAIVQLERREAVIEIMPMRGSKTVRVRKGIDITLQRAIQFGEDEWMKVLETKPAFKKASSKKNRFDIVDIDGIARGSSTSNSATSSGRGTPLAVFERITIPKLISADKKVKENRERQSNQ